MTEHRLHPFAALRVLRKTLVLYLVPLLRVLFERNWAALRQRSGRILSSFCWSVR